MPSLMVDYIISLDGYAAADGWPGYWGLEGPEYLAWLDEEAKHEHTVLMGATTYRLMSGFAAEMPDESSLSALSAMPKVVFSSTLKPPLSWANTELVDRDAVETVRDMKRDSSRPLRHNPAVALTIDTEVHPPQILLIRGRAELDVVEGIPDEYLQMNGSYTMTPEQRVEWEAEVRSLYDGMVRIVVEPTWAKLIDFETTLPSAVEELSKLRDERQRA
jgi:hypothetical protein